jgi:hypothetical protein
MFNKNDSDLIERASQVEDFTDSMLETMTGSLYPEDVNKLALLLLKKGLEYWHFRNQVHTLRSTLEFSTSKGLSQIPNKDMLDVLNNILDHQVELSPTLNISNDTMDLLKRYADSLVAATKDNSQTALQREESRSYAVQVLCSIIFDPANNIGLVRDRLIEIRRFESLSLEKQVNEKNRG